MQTSSPFEQATQLSELTTNIIKRNSDFSLETMNAFLNVSSKHLTELSTHKGLENLFNAVNDIGSIYLNYSQRAINVALENFADLSKWLEKNSQNMNPININKAFTDTEKNSKHEKTNR